MATYYVKRGGKQNGPMAGGALKKLATSGKLRKDDLIREGEAGKFMLAGKVKGLFPKEEPVEFAEEIFDAEEVTADEPWDDFPDDDYGAEEESTPAPSRQRSSQGRKKSGGKRGKSKGRYSSKGSKSSKSGEKPVQLYAAGGLAGFGLLLCLYGVVAKSFFAILVVAPGLIFVGGGVAAVGTILGAVVAFNDETKEGLLYLFAPFYALYYISKRWDKMRDPAGWIGSGAACMLFGVTIGAMAVTAALDGGNDAGKDAPVLKPIATLEVDLLSVGSMEFSPDGKTLIANSKTRLDDFIRFNIQEKRILKTVSKIDSVGAFASFTKDGKRLAIYNGNQDEVQFIDIAKGTIVRNISVPLAMSLFMSPDKRFIASRNNTFKTSTLRVLNSETGKLKWEIELEKSHILGFSSNGKMLATGVNGNKKRIDIWNVNSGEKVRTISLGSEDDSSLSFRVSLLALSPDGSMIAAGLVSEKIKIWKISTGEIVQTIDTSQFGKHSSWCLQFLGKGMLPDC